MTEPGPARACLVRRTWAGPDADTFTGELTAVSYEPGEFAPDAASRLIEEARRIGLGIE